MQYPQMNAQNDALMAQQQSMGMQPPMQGGQMMGQPMMPQQYQQQPNYGMPNPNMAQPMGQPMGMPNPQPIYQPPQPGIVQQQPTVVVVTTNNGAHHSPHTAHPENLVCQSCQSQVISRVEHEAGERTHLTALLLCVLGGGACGICLVPYCMKDCQDAVHYCPQCGTRIGQKTFRW